MYSTGILLMVLDGRIEIKSHPELTDKGAWRQVKEGKKPWQDFEIWKEGCGNPKYGGFYTQEENQRSCTIRQRALHYCSSGNRTTRTLRSCYAMLS